MTAADPTPDASVEPTMPVAVYTGPGVLEVQTWDTPTLGPRQVLVEVGWCGICGSDLHLVVEGWGTPGVVPGHELSGRVVAVGDEVQRWSIGDRVIGGATPRCGTCAMCRAGRPSLCSERSTPGRADPQGGFARYLALDERAVLAVPDELTVRAAALAEPLAVGLHAITRSGVGPGQPALVSGAGPIGALLLAALVARGIGPVDVVEPNEGRAELARRLGARRVLRPDEVPPYSIAEPDRLDDEPVDVVFECSGKRAAMESGLCRLARGGTMVIVGTGMEPPRLDANRILLNELVVTGSFVYDVDGFEAALELLASGRMPVDELLEPDDVPLHGVVDAMRGLADGTIARKVLVRP